MPRKVDKVFNCHEINVSFENQIEIDLNLSVN